jgi:AcrR family transcriptional regulator
LFSKFGSRRTTVEEICREAGVSKMTFYKYFRSKVALVETVRDNWIDEGFRRFDEIKTMNISFPEKIDLMTEWRVEFGRRVNAEFVRELVSTEDAMDEYRRRYVSNIRAAQLKGEVRSDIDPEFLWAIIERLDELVKDGTAQVPQDQVRFSTQLRTLLWYGLLTRKGSET